MSCGRPESTSRGCPLEFRLGRPLYIISGRPQKVRSGHPRDGLKRTFRSRPEDVGGRRPGTYWGIIFADWEKERSSNHT